MSDSRSSASKTGEEKNDEDKQLVTSTARALCIPSNAPHVFKDAPYGLHTLISDEWGIKCLRSESGDSYICVLKLSSKSQVRGMMEQCKRSYKRKCATALVHSLYHCPKELLAGGGAMPSTEWRRWHLRLAKHTDAAPWKHTGAVEHKRLAYCGPLGTEMEIKTALTVYEAGQFITSPNFEQGTGPCTGGIYFYELLRWAECLRWLPRSSDASVQEILYLFVETIVVAILTQEIAPHWAAVRNGRRRT